MIKYVYLNRFLFVLSFTALFSLSDNGYCAESVTVKENLEKLIKTNSCRGCDLSGANLNRMDLSDVDLEGANLSKVTLYLANLSRANLRNANLKGVAFGGADLAEADLRGADLRGTSLDGAYLGGTMLDGMFVLSKPYEDVGVSEIEKEVYVEDQSKPKQKPKAKEIVVAPRRILEDPPPNLPVPPKKEKIAEKINYPQAPKAKKLTSMKEVVVPEESTPVDETSALGQKKEVADLDTFKMDTLARLLKTNRCYGCDLSAIDFTGKKMRGADLEKSDLSGCNFEKADLEGANLKGAILVRANFRETNLKKADFYRADLTGADLTGASVQNTLFDSAELSGVTGLASQ